MLRLAERAFARGTAFAASALLLLLATAALPNAALFSNAPKLSTTCGEVSGTLAANSIVSFKGIPFADVPKRWTPPEPCVPWQGVRDGSDFGAPCVASDGSGDEDCLFLNVFAHKDVIGDEKAELPVMVFIYGGVYEFGASNIYDATEAVGLMNKSAIMVTINYRMNIHGFLGSDMLRGLDTESGSTGTYGYQDQRMAFKWVKDNARYFGGDPSNVMIFGQSGGSGSVSFHLVAQKSFGLYQKAAMESSAFFTDIAQPMFRREAIFSQVLALGNCGDVACLQAKTTAELTKIVQSLPQLPKTNLVGVAWVNWSPAIDGVEISEHPYHTLVNNPKKVNPVPVLYGTCRDEGGDVGGSPFPKNGTLNELIKFWTPFYEPLIGKQGVTDMVSTYVEEQAHEKHASNVPGSPTKFWWAAMRAWNDQVFACTDRQFSMHAGSAMPIYHYEFRPRSMPIVPHTSELYFLFRTLGGATYKGGLPVGWDVKGRPGTTTTTRKEKLETLSAEEEVLSAQVIKMWTHFAKTGQPTPTVQGAEAWPRFDPNKDGPYIQLNVPSGGGNQLAYNYRKETCENGPIMKWIEAVLESGAEGWGRFAF